MICPYCGKDNPESLDICEFCGGPLTVVDQEAIEETNPLEPKYTVVETPPQPEVLPPPMPVQSLPPAKKPANRAWWLVGCIALIIIFLCCAFSLIVFYQLARNIGASPSQTLNSPLSLNVLSTRSPANDPNVLFFDDFSDPTSGWDTMDTADYYSDYYQDSYRMTVLSGMSDVWANPDHKEFGDVHVEVDATKNGGPDDNDFGLICRYQSSAEYYYAVISSDGFYGILKVTNDATTQLGFTELQPSNAIHQGSSSNQVRFDCIGNVLSLYVNGQEIDRQTDSTYTSGNVGLIAGTYDTPGTDILFDNFKVLKP